MDLQLADKTALVTGSTGGIGLAIAQALAAEGARVIINGRTRARVDAALNQVKGNATGVAADLSTPAGADTLFAAVPAVDVLVNNLGIFEVKPFDQITDGDWDRFFQTNVMSGVRLSRFYFPKMIAKNWGRVVFISSESAANIPAEMIHYGMTKTAQLSVARGLAQMTAGTGVTVNSVLVGPTRSEGVGDFVASIAKQKGVTVEQVEADFFKHTRPGSLLQRFIEPPEIGSFVTYLASPRAAAINGAALRAEGGVLQPIL
jgi:NAD(P)-dependent dehydrogenase (short-subunit alcohol dehydrogenase family)